MIILTIKIEHSSLYGEGCAQFNFFKIYCAIKMMGGILFMKKYIIIVALLTSFYYPLVQLILSAMGKIVRKINRKKTLILIQIIQVRMNQILLNNHLKKIL